MGNGRVGRGKGEDLGGAQVAAREKFQERGMTRTSRAQEKAEAKEPVKVRMTTPGQHAKSYSEAAMYARSRASGMEAKAKDLNMTATARSREKLEEAHKSYGGLGNPGGRRK